MSDVEQDTPDYRDPLALLIGGVGGLLMANLAPAAYEHLLEFPLQLPVLGPVTVHMLVAEILMVVFFTRAAKEVRESFLRKGALREGGVGVIIAGTLGGVAVPALAFIVLAAVWQPEFIGGWPVATATDVALALVVGRLLVKSVPVVTFLVTLAILDDAIGVVLIAALFSGEKSLTTWLLLGLSLAFSLGMPLVLRCLRVRRWGWYFLCGLPALVAFVRYDVPPPIAMVLIVVFMPHVDHDYGPYATAEHGMKDALNRMADQLAWPQTVILTGFAFVSTGVHLTADAFGIGTLIVLLALVGGKLFGVWSLASLAHRCGLALPTGMNSRQLPIVGGLAAIGFTVALLVVDLAGLPDPYAIGAMLTLPAGVLLVLLLHYRYDRSQSNASD